MLNVNSFSAGEKHWMIITRNGMLGIKGPPWAKPYKLEAIDQPHSHSINSLPVLQRYNKLLGCNLQPIKEILQSLVR